MKRECEERMELIDALGEAREQLLILKKPAGSSFKVQCSGCSYTMQLFKSSSDILLLYPEPKSSQG